MQALFIASQTDILRMYSLRRCATNSAMAWKGMSKTYYSHTLNSSFLKIH